MRGVPGGSGTPRSFWYPQAGFTLVELMITVGIVGILVMVAIPNFMRFRERAKISEAKANLGAIRVTEFAYYTEYSHFVGNQPFVPDRTADPTGRLPFPSVSRFTILGYAPDGTVYFSYGLAGVNKPADNFTARATSDLDGDGLWSTWNLVGGDKELHHEGSDL